jgi:hypothetical protein
MTEPIVVGREVLLDNEWLQVAAKVVRGMPGSTGDQRFYVTRPHDRVCEGLEPVLVDLRAVSALPRSSGLDDALRIAALMLALTRGCPTGLIAP